MKIVWNIAEMEGNENKVQIEGEVKEECEQKYKWDTRIKLQREVQIY